MKMTLTQSYPYHSWWARATWSQPPGFEVQLFRGFLRASSVPPLGLRLFICTMEL